MRNSSHRIQFVCDDGRITLCFPASLISSPVLMVVALCSTSAPGEITRRNGVASACSIPTPYTGKVDGPRPHRCGDRSPGAFWCPASLESVDHWPLAIPDTQIPGGSRPAESAVRRRARGVRTLHPRTICRSQTAPARAA